MSNQIVAQLQKMEPFREVPQEHLAWLVEQAQCRELAEGDTLFEAGEPLDHMYVVLRGELELRVPNGQGVRQIGRVEEGGITGTLPFSRAEEAPGEAVATKAARVLMLHRDCFREMEQVSRPLLEALVHEMTSRVREFTRTEQQNEKMLSLGKLAAGLAHELNNPAAAISRSAQELQQRQQDMPHLLMRIATLQLNEEQLEPVNEILSSALANGQEELSLLERTEQEDDLLDWLEEQEVNEPDCLAEDFVAAGLEAEDLDEVRKAVGEEALEPVLEWMHSLLLTTHLIGNIGEASGRISELVGSIKRYSHMDRAPEREPVNIHHGLDSTLVMLGHKLRRRNINVKKQYDEALPQVPLFVSNMNQVWTNLIDNAIDAMQPGGTLTIRTRKDGLNVKVLVADTGSGIPEEERSQIWDPFFTTKSVGEGTGLGLDLVQRIIQQHNGDIDIESQPGKTVVTVCLPLEGLDH